MAIKRNVIKTDIGDYVHYIRGVKKSGKSTLFRDLVLLLHRDEDRGLLISFRDEDGYKSLDRLQYEVIEEWDMEENEDGERGFIQLVDDLVENNGTSYGIKMLAYDTIDKLIEVATKEVLKLSVRETGKSCKSLNEAFGGYGRGKERLIKLIQEQTFRLKKIGLNPFVLGHTKYKDKVDEITGTEYSQLTSSLTSDLDAIFGDTAQMVMTISLDKVIEDNKIVGINRVMHFRDDGLVDCGSRFPGLPEELPLSAENYVIAFEQGVKSSFMTSDVKESPKNVVNKKTNTSVTSTEKLKEGSEKSLSETIKNIKITMKRGLKEKKIDNPAIIALLSKFELKTPDEITSVDTAKNILDELNKIIDGANTN